MTGSIMADVLVVLTHWKRTANLLIQLEAFAAQTVPVDIVVVDNGPTQLHEMRGRRGTLRDDVLEVARDVYSIRENAGPSCRFVAPMMDLTHKWCLLYDDDAVPERGAVEYLLKCWSGPQSLSEIGSIGRRFSEDEVGIRRYNRRDVPLTDGYQRVDMLCRAHFFRTVDIEGVLELRHKLIRVGVSPEQVAMHDDLLMLGMASRLTRPTLIPSEPDGCKLIGRELESNDALHQSEGFMRSRNEMLAALQSLRVIS